MATIERKRVTLHPLNADGTMDTKINLYPKTFIDGIVDRQGNEVAVQKKLTAGENITIDENNVISAVGGEPVDAYTKEESDERFVAKEEGKGLSTNDYTDDDKLIVDNVAGSTKIYKYLTTNESLITLPVQNTVYFVDSISARGLTDENCSMVEINPEYSYFRKVTKDGDEIDVPILQPTSEEYETVKLYKTGLLENLRTEFYAYDSVDLINKKINRYCEPISFIDFLTLVDAQKPQDKNSAFSWTKASGTLTTKHEYIAPAFPELVSTFGWTISIYNDSDFDSISAKSLGSVNFALNDIWNLVPEEERQGFPQQASAVIKWFTDDSRVDSYRGIKLIFKLNNPTEELLSDYYIDIANNSIKCNQDDLSALYVNSSETQCFTIAVSYQSLSDYVYSKEQVDEKFQLIAGYEHIIHLAEEEIEASLDIYKRLEDLGYPKVAYLKCSAAKVKSLMHTQWQFKNKPTLSLDDDYVAVFRTLSESTIYSHLIINSSGITYADDEDNEYLVYDATTNTWTNDSFKSIDFKLVSEKESELIPWLYDNATLLSTEEDLVPFLGDTIFINQRNKEKGFGYYTISNGKNYWFTKTSVEELTPEFNLGVLKDVVIDSSNDPAVITFPENVLPIRFYWDDYGHTFYFNYFNLEVLDEDGYSAGNITYENKQVVVTIDGAEGCAANPDSDQLASWLIDGSNFESVLLNTYTLYHQSSNDVELMTETTYSNLVSLRSQNKLVPGMKYRITDYNCVVNTTSYGDRPYVTSAGHQFDIIVTALTTNKLSEEARATLHTGDTYFQNCNLNAWKLWYCLDNDYIRYGWAPYNGGKGVIYRMIDEFGNDCPYDFKNILFRKTIDGNQLDVYTFCRNYKNQYMEDVTVKAYNYRYLYYDGCYDNVITGKFVGSSTTNIVINLPANVFYTYNTWSANNFTAGWVSNKLLESTNCIFLGTQHYRNIITKGSTISLSNDTSQGGCYDNIISESSGIQTGFNFQSNKIEYSSGIKAGQSCNNNHVKYSSGITFDNWNEYNFVDSNCSSIRFGPSASKNKVGINCSSCVIGAGCENNILQGNNQSVGLGFNYNIGSGTEITDGYVYNSVICLGVNYLKLLGDTSGSDSNIIDYVTVKSGVTGDITVTRVDKGSTHYPVTYKTSGETEVVI